MKPTTYSDAGVDIDAATRATDKIKELAKRTFNERTLSEIGSFGGMFDGAFPKLAEPVLVASADGVGTKLKVAFATGIHNTVGRDLVNHCVNDILVQGARPLFFLDYIATGKLSTEVVAGIVEGVANGCRENGCVLLGGETAEMPGFYAAGEYDIAGFIVGVVDRERVIDGSLRLRRSRRAGRRAPRVQFFVFCEGRGGGPKSPYSIKPDREASSFCAARPVQTSVLASFAVLIS